MVNWIILATAIIKSLPVILIFLYCFRDTIKIKMSYVMSILAALELFLIANTIYTVPRIDSNSWARLASVIFSIVVQCILIHIWTTLSLGQNLYITFLMYNIIDDIDLLLQSSVTTAVPIVEKVNGTYLLKLTLYTIIVQAVLFVFMKHYLQPLASQTKDLSIWNAVCVIPIVLFVIFRFAIYPNYFNQGFVWSDLMIIMPVVWTVGTFAIQFFVMNGLITLSENIRLERELTTMRALTEAQRKQYIDLTDYIQSNRRLRHDFRQSLLVIRQYAREGKCESILQHIQAYTDEMDSHNLEQICENVALNTILQYYKEKAENNGITFHLQVQAFKETGFSEMDLCVLVGNLLENAIEACLRQIETDRYIKLKIEMKSPCILSMMISNSYEGSIRQKSERYLSSKREDFGIGIASVQHITEKYDGFTKISHENQWFTVYVLLNGRK